MRDTRSAPKGWGDFGDLVPFGSAELVDAVLALQSRDNIVDVYISGSIAEGFGNPRSDIDAYALVRYGKMLDDVDGFEVGFIRGKPIQFDFIPVDFIDGALAQLNGKHPWEVRLTRLEIQALHRLKTGTALMGSSDLVAYKADLSGRRFNLLCADRKAREAQNSMIDAYGCAEVEDFASAIYAARMALQRGVDAVVCLRGETANNDKWIFPRTGRGLGWSHPLAEVWIDLYEASPLRADVKAQRAYVEKCIRMSAAGISAYAGAWVSEAHECGGLNNLVNAFLDGIGVREEVGRRSEAFLLPVSAGAVLYQRGNPTQQLSPRATAIWLAACGGVGSEVAANAASVQCPELFESDEQAASLAGKLVPSWEGKGLLA